MSGTTTASAQAHRPFYSIDDFRPGSEDVTITVNREFVEKGEHHDEALALLGVDRNEMDQIWRAWAVRRGAGSGPREDLPGSSKEVWEARRKQEGAYWQVRAEVAGPQKLEMEDLAFADQRDVHRTVNFRARVWKDMTKSWTELGDAGFTHVEETKSLEAACAVGLSHSGVDDEDIESTAHTIAALKGATEHLVNAHREITYALQVADKRWLGDRANAVKFHFGAELLVVEGIRDAVHEWEDFCQRTHREQRLAQDQDRKFRNMVLTELAISGALLFCTFGAGTVARAGTFIARLVSLTEEFRKARLAIRGFQEATFRSVARALGSVRTARAASWGTVNVAHAGAVRHAGGQDLTLEDWVLAYTIAGSVEGALALRALMARRFGIGFRSALPGERPTFGGRATEPAGPGPAHNPGPTGPPVPRTRGPGTSSYDDAQRAANLDARGLAAAKRFQADAGNKLDGGAATTDAVEETFRRTMAGGRSTAKEPGIHFPQNSRASAREIRSVRYTASEPGVESIHGIPSSGKGPSPDYAVYVTGRTLPTRLEITTVTGAPGGKNIRVPRGHVPNKPTQVKDIVGAVRAKLYRTSTKPNQLTAPVTLPDGTVVPIGGTLDVHLPQLTTNGPATVSDAMGRLAPLLKQRPELERIRFYLPNHEPPIVYVRNPEGVYEL